MKNYLNSIKFFLFALTLSGASMPSFASAWHLFWSVQSDSNVYFFDGETFEMQAGHKLVWIKNVRKNSPDSDGAWASSARYKINCKSKTYQILAASDYDASNKFIKSYTNAGPVSYPAPDTVVESIVNSVCKANFPNDTSNDSDYWKLPDNDVFRATKKYMEWQNKNLDRAPV